MRGHQERPQADLQPAASIKRIDRSTRLLAGPGVGRDCFTQELNRDILTSCNFN